MLAIQFDLLWLNHLHHGPGQVVTLNQTLGSILPVHTHKPTRSIWQHIFKARPDVSMESVLNFMLFWPFKWCSQHLANGWRTSGESQFDQPVIG